VEKCILLLLFTASVSVAASHQDQSVENAQVTVLESQTIAVGMDSDKKVPQPNALALIGLSLLSLSLYARRKRASRIKY